MYRFRFLILEILGLLYCINMRAGIDTQLSKYDVDSIGDLWIFTLDKTGSMLSERTVTGSKIQWTPQQIRNDVIGKLSKDGGILDQIDYANDRITIMETGYGNKNNESDSYGYVFSAAPSLDSSFVHIIQPLKKFNSNKKQGLQAVLSGQLSDNSYNYRESFVSQIRVLSLHRLIQSICEEKSGLIFRKIHIVTVTDDADVNDQWKMDYYTIKRDPQKMKQLDRLHSKYVYSSFTQKGAGYLDERNEFTDVSSKNHIYMYDYVTRQQNATEITCQEDSLITVSPLDGKVIDLTLHQKQINSDSICFAYIHTLTINETEYPIDQYLSDTLRLSLIYNMRAFSNDIILSGKIQVLYLDSIYGLHYKSYIFNQQNKDYTATVHSTVSTLAWILTITLTLCLIYIFIIRPRKTLFILYTPDGQQLRVRQGFSWQWDDLTPIAYSCRLNTVFAKHACFKKGVWSIVDQTDKRFYIKSRYPLTFDGNIETVTSNNESRGITKTNSETIQHFYQKTLVAQIEKKIGSKVRRIRSIIFRICPNYYYWGDNLSGIITCLNHHFLIESSHKNNKATRNDCWLNTYYQGSFPIADAIICNSEIEGYTIWDVYQLCPDKMKGYGIRFAKHLMHYQHKGVEAKELNHVNASLKTVIHKELGVQNVIIINTDNQQGCENNIHYEVSDASYLTYICLVENTEEKKCQILYSPFKDTDSTEKKIIINSSTVSRKIWASVLPFISRPQTSIAGCLNETIIMEGPSCQKTLLLRDKTIEFDNIVIKPQN